MSDSVAQQLKEATINDLDRLAAHAEKVVKHAQEIGSMPSTQKMLNMVFSADTASRLVGRNRSTLSRAGKDKLIPEPSEYIVEKPKKLVDGVLVDQPPAKRFGYKFDDVHLMRQHFKSFPHRDSKTDEPIIVAVQNFKGGSSKSTVAVSAAHYFVRKGYRVLLIDCDPQGTATCAHGIIPEVSLNAEDTMAQILAGTQAPDYIKRVIRKTYWPQLDLIGSNIFLSNAEMQLFASMVEMKTQEQRRSCFLRFRRAIDTVKENYDIILLDAQPGLGALGVNTFLAADAIIVPCPPRMYDFASTGAFFKMWADNLNEAWPDKRYKWIRILPTQVQLSMQSQAELLELMRSAFGKNMSSKVFLFKQDIQRAASMLRSPFEDPDISADIVKGIEALFETVEIDIKRGWPSRTKELEAMAEV